MIKLYFSVVFVLFLAANGFSIKRDSTYIKDFSRNFILKFNQSVKSTALELKNISANKTLKLSPNDSKSVGLDFSYKWLGLGIGITPGFMNKDNKIYGKTSRFDFQINSYAKSYLLNVYLQWYKGFYVENPGIFDKNWKPPVYPQIPSAQISNFGSTFFLILNPEKFSYRSVYLGNEVQMKRSGTWLLGGGFNFSVANSEKYFLPDEWIPIAQADSFTLLKNYGFMNFFFSGGGSYTFVWFNGNLFLNLSLIFNVGPYFGGSKLHLINDDFSKASFNLSLSNDGRLSFGGNIGKKKKWFWMINAIAFNYHYSIENYYDISPVVKKASLVIGFRFI